MKKFLLSLFFVSFFANSKTFLDCEFSQWTDLEDGRTYTKEYYQKEYPAQKFLHGGSVYLEVLTSEKRVRFFPNEDLYSTFLCSTCRNGDGHNGRSDGNYHEIKYSETGNLIKWSFILDPKYRPVTWKHSLDRYGGNLKIQYLKYWTREYKCKKSSPIF